MPSIHAPEYIEFITRLRNARKAKSLTQAQLAALLQKPQSFVSKVETCERRLDVIEAAEWCAVLGIKIEDVLPHSIKSIFESEDHQSLEPGSQKGGGHR
jgi:transcriptional regulator with XRE-family HTH domain